MLGYDYLVLQIGYDADGELFDVTLSDAAGEIHRIPEAVNLSERLVREWLRSRGASQDASRLLEHARRRFRAA